MVRCYLSQHGLAVEKQHDPARPLSTQGREDIARVAGFLSLFTKPRPSIIYCSDKLRARQSADMFAEGWQAASPLSTSELAPNADPTPMAQRLSNSSTDIMVVGHLPYLEQLASYLLLGLKNGAPIRFVNGGVVCLQRNQTTWQICWHINPTMFS